MKRNTDHNNQPKNRIILLGASNLTMSHRLIVQLLQQRCGYPSEVLVAAGHGRSYGLFSQVLMRGLPGIIECGLWAQLESSEALPTYAFLTDVGNDIPYEYTPEQILAWVNACVERLQRHSAHIVMSNLCVKSIESLSERRYNFLRNLLYPFCQLSRDEVVDRARKVHHGLIAMASRQHFELCELEPDWFGFDGIHVRYCKRRQFYQQHFERFSLINNGQQPVVSGWKKRPQFAYQTMWGRGRFCQQPSGRLADGTTVAMY
ncbi:MAG: hypothetical protein OEX82_00855 [Nitrosomonas sp.]|nr:hypothetical protein [Nitrosomonas sp.]